MRQVSFIWRGIAGLLKQWFVRLAIGLGLLAWLLMQVDVAQVLGGLAQFPLWALGAAFLIFIVIQIIYAWRWRYLLAAQQIHVSLREALGLNYLSLFMSNFLPGSVGGDVVKWLAVAKPISQRENVLASIVVDRFSNLVANLVLLLLVSIQAQKLLHSFAIQWDILNDVRAWALLLVIFLLLVGIGLFAYTRPTVREWLRSQVARFVRTFAVYGKARVLLIALFASMLGLLVGAVSGYLVANAAGMRITYLDMLLISLVLQLAVLLPLSLNGVGIVEVGYVALFVQLGARAEQALAFAIVSRILYLLCTLPGSWYFLRSFGVCLR